MVGFLVCFILVNKQIGGSTMEVGKDTTIVRLSQTQPDEIRRIMVELVGKKMKVKIYNGLKELDECYPDFEKWYYSKVIPEFERKDDKREIIVSVSSDLNKNLTTVSGIAILKKTDNEKKICTIKVHSQYRNKGIGSKLFEESFKYLETDRPIMTVSENTMPYFNNFINKYKFELSVIRKDYYKKGISEYFYNIR